jgi:hypothetical protein
MFADMPSFAEIMRSMAWLMVLAASFLMPILTIALAAISGFFLLSYLTANATIAYGRRALVPIRA